MSKNKKNTNIQKNYNNKTNQDGSYNIEALDRWSFPVFTQTKQQQNNFFEKKIKKTVDTKKNINYIINDGYKPLGNSLPRGTQSPVFKQNEKSECEKRYERKQVLFSINKNGKNSGNYKKTRSKIGC